METTLKELLFGKLRIRLLKLRDGYKVETNNRSVLCETESQANYVFNKCCPKRKKQSQR